MVKLLRQVLGILSTADFRVTEFLRKQLANNVSYRSLITNNISNLATFLRFSLQRLGMSLHVRVATLRQDLCRHVE